MTKKVYVVRASLDSFPYVADAVTVCNSFEKAYQTAIGIITAHNGAAKVLSTPEYTLETIETYGYASVYATENPNTHCINQDKDLEVFIDEKEVL